MCGHKGNSYFMAPVTHSHPHTLTHSHTHRVAVLFVKWQACSRAFRMLITAAEEPVTLHSCIHHSRMREGDGEGLTLFPDTLRF